MYERNVVPAGQAAGQCRAAYVHGVESFPTDMPGDDGRSVNDPGKCGGRLLPGPFIFYGPEQRRGTQGTHQRGAVLISDDGES
jgi:hypothetical protein